LFIADEVITGIGRTGKNFAIEHWGVTLDMITTAKALSSGYAPLAAVILHDKVYDAIAQGSGHMTQGFTYSGHPLCSAVGLTVLRYLKAHKLVENAVRIGRLLLDRLTELKKYPIVGDVRGTGLILGSVWSSWRIRPPNALSRRRQASPGGSSKPCTRKG
jgi:adenosylmethionine-8-amino-7-oxononanoate aminotransferase